MSLGLSHTWALSDQEDFNICHPPATLSFTPYSTTNSLTGTFLKNTNGPWGSQWVVGHGRYVGKEYSRQRKQPLQGRTQKMYLRWNKVRTEERADEIRKTRRLDHVRP